MAILGSPTFDTNDVDEATLAFGPSGAAPARKGRVHFRDVNNDGVVDLVSQYRMQETGIALGDVEACITAETRDGVQLEGCDAITTAPRCGDGYEVAFISLPLAWAHRRRRNPAARVRH